MNAVSSPVAGLSKAFKILELDGQTRREVDANELRQRFKRDGVVILSEFLNEDEMVPVRRLDNYFAPLAEKASEIHNGTVEKIKKFECDVICWDPFATGNEVFRQLHANPRLAEVTEITIGADYTAPRSLVMYSVGGGRGQAWHQDCPPVEQLGFNLNRLFYNDDVTLEDGAIVVVPGSHHMCQIPPGGHQDPLPGEVTVTPKAGTLILLHGHVYHRVTPNLNMKPRTSVNFRAFPKGVPSQVTCIGVYRNGMVNFCDQAKQHDGTPAML